MAAKVLEFAAANADQFAAPVGSDGKRHKKSRLTKAAQDAIIVSLRTGICSFSTACVKAGVSYASAKEWRARGHDKHRRPAREPYITFARLCDEAEAEGEFAAAAIVYSAAMGGQVLEDRTISQEYEMRPNEQGHMQKVLVGEKVVTTRRTLAPNAQAAQWILARKWPEKYAQREVIHGDVDMTHKIIEVPPEAPSIEAWAKEVADLRDKNAPPSFPAPAVAGHGNGAGNGKAGAA